MKPQYRGYLLHCNVTDALIITWFNCHVYCLLRLLWLLWLLFQALSRLLTAYDTAGNRLVRFIKLSLSLICGVHCGATEISSDSHSRHSGGLQINLLNANANSCNCINSCCCVCCVSIGLFKLSEDPMEMLIRMMHCLYEHLECGVLRYRNYSSSCC